MNKVASAILVKNVLGVLAYNAKKLSSSIHTAGLVKKLEGEGIFTVFAPNDAAMESCHKILEDLSRPENKAKLTQVLSSHIVEGKIIASELKNGQLLTNLDGNLLKVAVHGGRVTIEGAHITTPNLNANNGIVHLIDQLLIPPAEISIN